MKSPPGDHSPKTVSEIKELTKIPDNDKFVKSKDKVRDSFKELFDKEGVEYTNKSGDKVYEIKKKYDLEDFNYDSDDTSNMFGNTISVYMDSIGQEFDEYLVNMDFLIDSFKKRGMELVTPNSKLNIFNDILDIEIIIGIVIFKTIYIINI